jgi:hypothetical protein
MFPLQVETFLIPTKAKTVVSPNHVTQDSTHLHRVSGLSGSFVLNAVR